MASKSQELAAYWKTQVEQVEEEYKRWYERGKRISARYRDEREKIDDERRHFNLFWSNVQTLKPAIYSRVPVPIVERRFLDKDPTGRVAAQILERALRYEVAMSGFDCAIRRARTDYLVPGRGQVWVRYNPQFGEAISPKQTAPKDIDKDGEVIEEQKEEEVEQQQQQVIAETIEVDYIHWQDYYQFPAKVRTEQEIEGKGRRIFMTREDMVDRWGSVGKKIPLDHVPGGLPDEGAKAIVASKDLAQATIYEIWWKPTRTVYFVAKEYDQLIEEVEDPLHLEGFFPCPEALHTTVTNDTMIPVPDYVESQDQYIQIDELTKRIDVLTGSLKVRGVYDASQVSLRRLFEEGEEPQLYPVDSWAAFAEKGGIQGSMSMVPLKEISDTLAQLIEVRTQLIQDLDRTTGIWDIMRGVSDARETLGAQRLKTNSGQTRIQERQDDMARFCRDIINIMGELISEHFDDQTLLMVSGAMFDEGLDPPPLIPPPQAQGPVPQIAGPQGQPGLPAPQGGPVQQQPQTMEEPPALKQMRKIQLIQSAIALLRQDKLRGFRIDIETDSTVQGDANEEKENRIAFIEGVTKFIEMATQTAANDPDFAPVAGKMLMFAVRGFRVGRDLESAIEEYADKAQQQAKTAQPPPNPELIKAQAEQMKAQAEIQRQMVENQGENTNAQIELRMKELDVEMKKMEMQMKAMELRMKGEEMQHGAIERHNQTQQGQLEMQFKQRQMEHETRKMGMRKMSEIGGKGEEVVDPHVLLMAQTAKAIELASRRHAAPKEIIRDKDGKAQRIVTHFKES